MTMCECQAVDPMIVTVDFTAESPASTIRDSYRTVELTSAVEDHLQDDGTSETRRRST